MKSKLRSALRRFILVLVSVREVLYMKKTCMSSLLSGFPLLFGFTQCMSLPRPGKPGQPLEIRVESDSRGIGSVHVLGIRSINGTIEQKPVQRASLRQGDNAVTLALRWSNSIEETVSLTFHAEAEKSYWLRVRHPRTPPAAFNPDKYIYHPGSEGGSEGEVLLVIGSAALCVPAALAEMGVQNASRKAANHIDVFIQADEIQAPVITRVRLTEPEVGRASPRSEAWDWGPPAQNR